jgi:hypothetical protein
MLHFHDCTRAASTADTRCPPQAIMSGGAPAISAAGTLPPTCLANPHFSEDSHLATVIPQTGPSRAGCRSLPTHSQFGWCYTQRPIVTAIQQMIGTLRPRFCVRGICMCSTRTADMQPQTRAYCKVLTPSPHWLLSQELPTAHLC